MYINEEIEIGIKTIVALNENLDPRVNVRAIAYDEKEEDLVGISIYWTEGYDYRLEKEMIANRKFTLPRKDWYKQGVFDVFNFIEELEKVEYDEEIDEKADREFYESENRFESERGN